MPSGGWIAILTVGRTDRDLIREREPVDAAGAVPFPGVGLVPGEPERSRLPGSDRVVLLDVAHPEIDPRSRWDRGSIDRASTGTQSVPQYRLINATLSPASRVEDRAQPARPLLRAERPDDVRGLPGRRRVVPQVEVDGRGGRPVVAELHRVPEVPLLVEVDLRPGGAIHDDGQEISVGPAGVSAPPTGVPPNPPPSTGRSRRPGCVDRARLRAGAPGRRGRTRAERGTDRTLLATSPRTRFRASGSVKTEYASFVVNGTTLSALIWTPYPGSSTGPVPRSSAASANGIGEDHAVEPFAGDGLVGTEDRLGHRREVGHHVDGGPEPTAATERLVVGRVVLVGRGNLAQRRGQRWIGTNGEKRNRPSSIVRIE